MRQPLPTLRDRYPSAPTEGPRGEGGTKSHCEAKLRDQVRPYGAHIYPSCRLQAEASTWAGAPFALWRPAPRCPADSVQLGLGIPSNGGPGSRPGLLRLPYQLSRDVGGPDVKRVVEHHKVWVRVGW